MARRDLTDVCWPAGVAIAAVMVIILVMSVCKALAATSYIYQKPLLENPTDAARLYIYDPVTNSDRNLTWGLLRGLLLPPAPTWEQVTGKPATFAPAAHDQAISTITGLQTVLDGKEPTGTAATAVGSHEATRNHPASTSDLPEGTNLYHTLARAAAAAPVQSVAGKTGAVSLNLTDVGATETCVGRLAYDGLDGTQIYYGSGAPSADLGVVKDFYIDGATWNTYRKEKATEEAPPTWTLKGNLSGPPNTLGIGTVTTLAYDQQATAIISGSPPYQALSLGLPQGIPGPPSSLSRGSIVTELGEADDTIMYLTPLTNSPTVGGLVVNDYGTNAAIIVQNGRIEVRDASGITLAKIDRAAGTIATYDTAGNLAAKLDRDGVVTSRKLVIQ